METNTNTPEAKQTASAGCHPTPFSRSSTPETSEAWAAVSRTPDGMYNSRVPISAYAYAMMDHSRKMESQRDQYAAILCEAMRVVYETTCVGDSTDLIERFEALELTPALSSENVTVEGPADNATPPKP